MSLGKAQKLIDALVEEAEKLGEERITRRYQDTEQRQKIQSLSDEVRKLQEKLNQRTKQRTAQVRRRRKK